MSERSASDQPLVEVGRYSRLAAARERALVVAAHDLPHWIEREGGEWVLRVEAPAETAARREVAAFEAEEAARPAPRLEPPEPRLETFSLYVAAWVMSAFLLLQNTRGPEWLERGVADSALILREGQWWRVVTALTLHGDLSHFAANLAAGLLFAGFTLRHFGPGLAWLGILGAGALGNLLNAWGYRGEGHLSIGASTAVFGALGMLVGAEFTDRLALPASRGRWQLVLPLGAGLGLLAYLGAGGDERQHVDLMAHWWGFVAGLALGAPAGWWSWRARTPRWAQRLSGLLALVLPALAWWCAWH